MELFGADRERTDEMGRCDSGCSHEEHLVILEKVSCLYMIRIYDFSMHPAGVRLRKLKKDVFITTSPAFFLLCALRFCSQICVGAESIVDLQLLGHNSHSSRAGTEVMERKRSWETYGATFLVSLLKRLAGLS